MSPRTAVLPRAAFSTQQSDVSSTIRVDKQRSAWFENEPAIPTGDGAIEPPVRRKKGFKRSTWQLPADGVRRPSYFFNPTFKLVISPASIRDAFSG